MEKKTLTVVSVNISEEKGTIKKPAPFICLNEAGVEGDAHAGPWHRQVSLLAEESIKRFGKELGRVPGPGEFAENITTRGLELKDILPLDRIVTENAGLEITQIGKKCHGSGCNIYNETGNCVMPKEGVFARVIKGGRLKSGDMMEYIPRPYRFLVITLSDRASSGQYEDKSGPAIIRFLAGHFEPLKRGVYTDTVIMADDRVRLHDLLDESCRGQYDFIITTGGTGVGVRDICPDTVKPMLDKEIPGIMEMIRMKYGSGKPNALLSRGVAGLMGSAFIYTLPGSVKAVNEYMTEIVKTMDHLLYMYHGIDAH